MTLEEMVNKHWAIAENRHKNQAEVQCNVTVLERMPNGDKKEIYRHSLGSIDEARMFVPKEYRYQEIAMWFLERNPLRYHIVIHVDHIQDE